MIRNVLTIAGSDPSGGAGIQADLKAFAANGTYGMAALTALTAQNTQGVRGIELVPAEFVKAQIEAVFADVRVDAVKIGMIATAEIALAVAEALAPHRDVPIVLDPVMVAKGGAPLLAEAAMSALRTALLPMASIVTPNLPEAARLLDAPEATDRAAMAAQARRLTECGPAAALVKGGHLDAAESPDVLFAEGAAHWFEAARTPTRNTHGTGCTLSSALAAHLARGLSARDAVAAAKDHVAAAIRHADALSVGQGHGPVHHFHRLWRD
ncbi:hydroxymethylpyrimidine kinase /phosphomethylpyrimidine kinase [Roseivivax lentus]|uniref:hydroxymethylpyrimidine kinase n=1 Tax=Roseivivax lentus TaxID=633194 RepID=A0A1N7NQK9_9RHOB|nr:bifunctional hydroxymethylpyrimidine kinase/phosphomethylpyrimidine kinase [Roseivivax lentus]SIT00539.1 hydroxymethylpyrimidine kinase /phosphomethylpyrimidine kinase [Roseivivax lentus]